MRKDLPVFLCLLVGACVTPIEDGAELGAKPGWDRGFTQEEREMSVRAVPAAAAPAAPETRLGKPGWGKSPR